MRHLLPLLVCAMLAACATSPVQSIIYATAGDRYAPDPYFAHTPPQFAERSVTRPDGQVRQYFWHETPATSHVMVYLHGNAEIAAATARSNLLAGLGADTAILEYTGYGLNTGTPSEAELRADASALIAHLRATRPGQKIILAGFSIGGALAVLLAADGLADGLVTFGTFTTLRDVAPAIGRPLIGPGHAYDALSAAAQVRVPWEIVHCNGDPIIPVAMARALMQAPKPAAARRSLRILPCDSHFVAPQFWPASLAVAKSG